jgi:hypothetical protein
MGRRKARARVARTSDSHATATERVDDLRALATLVVDLYVRTHVRTLRSADENSEITAQEHEP